MHSGYVLVLGLMTSYEFQRESLVIHKNGPFIWADGEDYLSRLVCCTCLHVCNVMILYIYIHYIDILYCIYCVRILALYMNLKEHTCSIKWSGRSFATVQLHEAYDSRHSIASECPHDLFCMFSHASADPGICWNSCQDSWLQYDSMTKLTALLVIMRVLVFLESMNLERLLNDPVLSILEKCWKGWTKRIVRPRRSKES